MSHAIDQVELHSGSKWHRCAAADLREINGGVQSAGQSVCGSDEPAGDRVGRLGVGANMIIAEVPLSVGSGVRCAAQHRIRESQVLAHHVRQQIVQRPAGARGRPAQIRSLDDGRQGDGLLERPSVEVNQHVLTIGVRLLSHNRYRRVVPSNRRRSDLAALLTPVTRAFTAAELPVLAAHGISMWAYAVLLRLDAEPLRSQAELAEAIGADKTRIIPVLDDLQRRGLIHREPDPSDRRVRLLSLTPEGAEVRDRAQRDIQDQEAAVLATLPAADRAAFLRVLHRLAESPELDRLAAKGRGVT